MTKRTARPQDLAPLQDAAARLGSPAVVHLSTEALSAIDRMQNGQNGRGWLRLIELLEDASSDHAVIESPGACEFLSVVIGLAKDSISKHRAIEALLPLDGLLPAGAFGLPFKNNAGRGEGAVKKLVRDVLPGLEKRLKRNATHLEVWKACAAIRKSGINFICHETWKTPVKAVPKGSSPATWGRFKAIVSEVRRTQKS